MSDPRSLVNLPPSLSIFLLERVGRRARARAFVQGTPPGRGKRGLGRMVGVGQIPGSEVANTVEVVGMAAYTNTTARELKVEEIAGTGGRWWGGRAGGGKRKKGRGGRGRSRATIQQERAHSPHLASERHTMRFSLAFLSLQNVSQKFVNVTRSSYIEILKTNHVERL